MLLLRLTVVGIAVIVSVGATTNFDEAKTNQIEVCFFGILCKAKKPEEFRRIMLKAHPKLIENGFRWLKEISNIDASDTPEFWRKYPDYKCPLPEETKHKYFMEWMKRLAEYWSGACMDANSQECIMMAAAENEYNIVSGEYTANGICPAEGIKKGQEQMEDGKKAAEEGVEKGKGAFKDMSQKSGGWGKK